MSNLRIVIFTVEGPPSQAGDGRNAYNFAVYLSHKIKTTLCHLKYNNQLSRKAKSNDLSIHRVRYYNKSIFSKFISIPGLLLNYTLLVLKHDIIIVYGGFLVGFQYILILAKILRKKNVFRSTILGGDDAYTLVHAKNKIVEKINFRTLKNLSLYFAINREFAFRFTQTIGKNTPMLVSFQGVDHTVFSQLEDLKKISAMRKKLGIAEHEFIIISVGFLLKRKGYDKLFEELSRLDFPFLYLVIGEYTRNNHHKTSEDEIMEMDELAKKGKKLLGEKVRFMGSSNHVEEYYSIANIFLHGSIQEGTPNVILEAMCIGLPIVVKKLPGLSGDLIKNGINAQEFDDFKELPAMLKKLYADRNLCKELGRNASALIREKYTFETVTAKLLDKL